MIKHADPFAGAWRRYRAAEVELEAAAVELREQLSGRMRALRTLAPRENQREVFTQVCRLVAERYGCEMADLFARSRTAAVVVPRQVAMTIAHELSGATLEAVGKFFRRDHGTVIHAERTVAARCATEPQFRASFAAVRQLCGGGG